MPKTDALSYTDRVALHRFCCFCYYFNFFSINIQNNVALQAKSISIWKNLRTWDSLIYAYCPSQSQPLSKCVNKIIASKWLKFYSLQSQLSDLFAIQFILIKRIFYLDTVQKIRKKYYRTFRWMELDQNITPWTCDSSINYSSERLDAYALLI